MPDTHSLNTIEDFQDHVARAWNILIPPCAIRAELEPWGVRYLHPTKGYRTVGKRRFAVRGVM